MLEMILQNNPKKVSSTMVDPYSLHVKPYVYSIKWEVERS